MNFSKNAASGSGSAGHSPNTNGTSHTESRLAELFKQAPAVMALLRGPDHVFDMANPAYMQFIGGKRDIIGKPLLEALPELKGQGFNDLLDFVYQTGEPYIGNEALVKMDKHGDGSLQEVFVNFVYQPFRNPEGEIIGVFVQGVDVTEMVRNRQQAQENERFLKTLVSNLPGAVYRCYPERPWDTIYISSGIYELTGYEVDDFLSGNIQWIDLIHPEDVDEVVSKSMEAIARKEVFTFTYRIQTRSGGEKWVWDRGTATYNPDGGATFIEGFITDVTERKTVEIEKQKLAAVVEATADFVGLASMEQEAMYINPAGRQILGWDSIDGRKMLDYIYPDDRQWAEDVLLPRLFKKGYFSHEIRFLNTQTGKPVWMMWNGTAVKDPHTGKAIALASVGSNISKLKEAKEALEASEHRLKEELDSMRQLHDLVSRLLICPDMKTALKDVLQATIAATGADMGNIQLVNAEGNLEIVAHQGLPDEFLEHFNSTDRQRSAACDRSMVAKERVIIEDVSKDQDFKPHLDVAESAGFLGVQSTPLLGRNGKVLGVLSTHFRNAHYPSEREFRILDLYTRQAADFVELFQSGEALRKSELRFKTYAEAMPQMAFIADPEGNIIYFNQRWYDYVGQMEGTEGWGWRDKPIHHPDDMQRTIHRWNQSLKTGEPYEIEYRLCRHDGEYRWHLGRAVPVRNGDDKIELWLGTNTDIHAQKQAEEALREREDYYKSMTDNTPVITWITGTSGYCSYLNQQWYMFTGQTQEAGLGFGWMDAVHPADIEETRRIFFKAVENRGAFNLEYRLRSSNGQYHWHLASGLPKFDDEGQFEGHVGAVININERKNAEEKLKKSEEFSRTLIESSPDSVQALDAEGKVVSMNSQTLKMLGATDAVPGFNWLDLWEGEYYDDALNAMQKAKKGRIGHFRASRETPGGEVRWWDILVAPVDGESKAIGRLISVSRDITKLKELEQQKDDFIGIASHELKTPVTSIKAYTQVLQMRFDNANDEQSAEMLSKMDVQLNKLTGLISDLLDVTRIEQGKLIFKQEQFSFNELVTEVVEEVQRTASFHTITSDLTEDRQITGDRDRIGQVITNYLTNAIKYSPKSKRVIIRTVIKDEQLVLSVQDYGLGLSEEDQDKVFERFYRVGGTGYETYPGLGLGLYISAEIIHRHHGQVSVESQQGEGSTFYFSLPLKNLVSVP